jgi:type II secretory pathway predicted ATPase ExeA|tara:strand:- start:489 stop:1292 length:804 start_codon:yes stop_codon:yes gene_type:complete
VKNAEMLSYFNLSQLPFGKEIPTEELHLLPSVEQNLASARLLIETRGIGVITGKAGTGKSSLLRLLSEGLPPGLYKSYYLCHSSVGIVEFYTHLCSLFGLQPSCRRATMFRELQQHILALNTTSHIHPVLAIDEAHLVNGDILAEIRLLTNFRFDSLNALTVILCGNETLTLKFGLSRLEALATSITITISVDSLALEETFSYIETRLKACGQKTPLFTKNAATLIHQASGGILRTIGTIATAALWKAFMGRSQQVEVEHVQAVIQR